MLHFICCLFLAFLVGASSQKIQTARGQNVLLFNSRMAENQSTKFSLYLCVPINCVLIAYYMFENGFGITQFRDTRYNNIYIDPRGNIWIANINKSYAGIYELHFISNGTNIIKQVELVIQGVPNFIKVKPNISVVKENDEWKVSCISDCSLRCSIKWIKQDQFSRKMKVLLEDGELQIKNVTREMSGIYLCKVENLMTGEFLESSLSLDVHYGPDSIVLNTSNKIIEVQEFDSITIICTTKCFPTCLISWTDMYTGHCIQGGELNLINVTTNGSYTCSATNPSISMTKRSETINIQVKIDTTLIPTIAIISHNASDSSVVLQCRSFRMPTGMFSWSANGSPINDNDRYSTDNVFLSVRHLTAEDQNKSFTCMEPGTKLQSNRFWIKASGPTFIKINPTSVMVNEYDELNVTCQTDCSPLCSVQWLKMDPTSVEKNIFSDENVLQLTDITRDMTGRYSCKVQNILTGILSESILSMVVRYGPDDILFNTSDNIIEVNEFDSITILCTAQCFPPCLINWIEMNTEIETGGVYLKLFNVKNDRTYTCHATNPNITNSTVSENIIIKVKLDETLIPRIEIGRFNAKDSSIFLHCVSSRLLTGQLSWRINGSVIINNDRYSEDNKFLFVRHLSDDDQYNLYTCIEPGTGFHSEPFRIKLKELLHMTSSIDQDQDIADIPHLVYVIPGTAAIGLTLSFVLCFLKKYIHCHGGAGVSTINPSAHSNIGEYNQDEIISQHYWTIGTNTRGEISTVLERNINMELFEFMEPAHTDLVQWDEVIDVSHPNHQECETYTHPMNSDLLEISSDSAEFEEFIDRIPSDYMRPNEYLDLIPSDTVECNEYIHAVPSDPIDPGGYIDPIPSDAMRRNEYIDIIPSDPVECSDYIHPIPSDPLDLVGYIDPIPSNCKEGNAYFDLIPSDPVEYNQYMQPFSTDYVDLDGCESRESTNTVDSIPSDHVDPNVYSDPIDSDDSESFRYLDNIPSDPIEIDAYNSRSYFN